jgi:hypothetical protein
MKLLSWLLVHTFGSSVQLSLDSVMMNRFAPSARDRNLTSVKIQARKEKEAETRKEKYVSI